MVAETASHLTLDLPCDELAPAAVRHALAEQSGARWIIGDVMLVASELVTNAVLHSGCVSDDVVSVELRLGSDAVFCAVSDPGRTGSEARPVRQVQVAGGFGLRVVEQLSLRWGSEREEDGRYRVWAEVSREPAATA